MIWDSDWLINKTTPSIVIARLISSIRFPILVFPVSNVNVKEFLIDLHLTFQPYIKDPNKSNTQKYFRHSNVKRNDSALLRSGYFFYFGRLDINCNFNWFEILNIECLWKSWAMNLSRVMNRSKRSSRAIILSIRLHFVIRDVKINFFVYPILTKQYNFHQCWPVFTLADNWKRCRGIIHWNKRGFMSKRRNTKKLTDKHNLWRSNAHWFCCSWF